MPKRVEGTIKIENARLLFRNFGGEERKFNAEGDRNFSVILTEEVAEQMLADGWNVKYLKPREDDENEVGSPYVQVSVSYKFMAPRITMIGDTTKKRTEIGEDLVGLLDWVDIVLCDIIIRPYNWEIPPRRPGQEPERGVKAYLKTMYITIEENELDLKYAEDPITPEG